MAGNPSSATNVIMNWPERIKTQPHDDRDNCFQHFDSKGPGGMTANNDIDDDSATKHSDSHSWHLQDSCGSRLQPMTQQQGALLAERRWLWRTVSTRGPSETWRCSWCQGARRMRGASSHQAILEVMLRHAVDSLSPREGTVPSVHEEPRLWRTVCLGTISTHETARTIEYIPRCISPQKMCKCARRCRSCAAYDADNATVRSKAPPTSWASTIQAIRHSRFFGIESCATLHSRRSRGGRLCKSLSNAYDKWVVTAEHRHGNGIENHALPISLGRVKLSFQALLVGCVTG